jgi:predicted nucleic acid-binding protein
VTPWAIADTGPLVAYLDRREQHHAWVAEQAHHLETPLLVCEPVLAETMFLLSRMPAAQDALFEMLQNGILKIAFHLGDHLDPVRRLRRKYCSTPISLADACVVRMAELFDQHSIFTLDAHFAIYRKRGRTPLPLIMPECG